MLSATVCGSDLHTITGKREEPTPRYFGILPDASF
jgi:threonine dehydrogenase-like Zn-dependent dehydrogenase